MENEKTLNFIYDAKSNNYVAETVVTDDFNLCIKYPTACVVVVSKSTQGDTFTNHRKYSVVIEPYKLDEDIDMIVYPKVIRISSQVMPEYGVCRIAQQCDESSELYTSLSKKIEDRLLSLQLNLDTGNLEIDS